MAVPVPEREKSTIEFLKVLMDIEKWVIRKTETCPKKYRFIVNNQLLKYSAEAYTQAKMGNSVRVTNLDLNFLRECESVLREKCEEYKISINKRKIKICKLSHGFTYLKKRYVLRDSKIIVKLSRQTFRAVKRRLKKMKEKNLPYAHILQAYKSWRGNCKGYDNWNRVLKMDKYFNEMFKDYEGGNL